MCGYLPTLVLFLLALTGRADTKSSVARLEARYRTAKTLEASFLERYTENGRLVRVEAGTVYFKRPGKMRWDYQAPERNLFLVDANCGGLVRVLVRDPGGVGIEFSFTNWRMDPQVPDSLFRFDVPKGVAIVNGELPSG